MSLFRPGDLVQQVINEPIDVYAVPPEVWLTGSPDSCGELFPNDVALVAALDKRDARCVLVLAARVCGWTFGAFLRRVKT